MMRMKSLLKYPGAKWRISDWLLSHFPKHKVYLEPYFGSGACFFNKEPAYVETINDIDGDIVNLFRVCRDSSADLARLISLTPFSREEFANCYERSEDPIEQARRTLVRYHQSFGTSNSSRNSWRNVLAYGGPRCATMWNDLPEIVQDVAFRLKEAQIENTDAISLIERYNHPQTLIYIDPPYLCRLRKQNIYKNEMSDKDHIKLLDTIKRSQSMIIISGYDNEMYNDALTDWYCDECTAQAQFGKQRIEKIWMNFSYQCSLF